VRLDEQLQRFVANGGNPGLKCVGSVLTRASTPGSHHSSHQGRKRVKNPLTIANAVVSCIASPNGGSSCRHTFRMEAMDNANLIYM
jgi:hypothetical protein